MQELNTILDVLTLVALTLGGAGLFLLREGAKTTAAEVAKAAVKQLDFQAELARELQKIRGVERQELRYESYGALWKELRPLAIYDDTVINKEVVGDLSTKLSDWYFSACGGLLLTSQARSFYFALQDLLRTTVTFSTEWEVDQSVEYQGEQREIFHDLLKARKSNEVIGEALKVFDYFSRGSFEDWQNEAADRGKKWRDGIAEVAASWNELDKRQRFATLQQVGSILRTSLTIDLESRTR